MKLTVVDYGLGNIFSVTAALRTLGFDHVVDVDGSQIAESDLVLVPGVAAFGAGMTRLRRSGQAESLDAHWRSGGRLAGLCLGAQMFLDASEEDPGTAGLAFVPGTVVRLDASRCRVPNQGWLCVDQTQPEGIDPLRIGPSSYFYFSHSYRMQVASQVDVVAIAWADQEDVTAVYRHENVIGVQFHPERSGETGLAFLRWLVADGSVLP